MDLKTSMLYENGTASLIQLDYHMDVTSLKKEFYLNLLQKRKFESVSSRHTTDLGSSAATSVSVTETTSVDEFLTNAEAAQKSFEAERGTARYV